jgi:hypothetical protein
LKLESGKEIEHRHKVNNLIMLAELEFKQKLKEQQAQNQTEESHNTINTIKANLEKLKRASKALLTDSASKKSYDQALLKSATINLDVGDGSRIGLELVPPTKIEQITTEFNTFVSEQVGKPKPSGGNYDKSDFTYKEDPPGVHTYTFPDKASAEAFMQQLFNKNLAMLPGGSQNTKDIWPQETVDLTAKQPVPVKDLLPSSPDNKAEGNVANSSPGFGA